MNLVLHLGPETEERLRQAAAETGKAPEALAMEALDEKLATSEDPEDRLSVDRWQQKLREVLAAIPRSTATFVDDSRESIYDGRGE